jgi:hypothetical protein
MLTLLMRFGEDFEQFLAYRDWFSLMTDHFLALICFVRIEQDTAVDSKVPTSAVPIPTV